MLSTTDDRAVRTLLRACVDAGGEDRGDGQVEVSDMVVEKGMKAGESGVSGCGSMGQADILDEMVMIPKLRAVSILACIIVCSLFWAGAFLAVFG